LRKERQLKKRRLARIARLLKRRLKRDSRIALIREAGQLEDEIGELTATIKEYKADVKGGAQTIEQAEEMEAGVAPDTGTDTGGGGDTGPDPVAAAAEAAAEADRQLKEALDALTKELAETRAFGERIQSTENFQLKKYLADVLGGQIVGYGVTGRSFTPGSGVEHAY
jgi:cell division septum initiation protein DivIVA